MIFFNVNVLAFHLHVLKLMSLILVKLNCPVRMIIVFRLDLTPPGVEGGVLVEFMYRVLAYQVRVTVGDSGVCFCVSVMFSEH